MSVKLIAVDMDDTLLDNSIRVSPRTREVLQKAAAQGVKVTIATGRMYSSALPFARQLGLDVPLITYNGAMIKNSISGETLLHHPIDFKLAKEVLGFFKKHGWYIQSYVDDVLYVAEKDEHALHYERTAGIKSVAIGEKLYTMEQSPTKMLAMAEAGQMPVISQAANKIFGDRLNIVTSKPTYLEIVNPKANKGLALAYLADMLGIKQAEVMAIGDSNNDLDMIKYAGWGVAMGNAADTVKAEARFVTKRNDEDGVAEAVIKYVLEGKR